jgi:hypothetical protein
LEDLWNLKSKMYTHHMLQPFHLQTFSQKKGHMCTYVFAQKYSWQFIVMGKIGNNADVCQYMIKKL